tara:strand:+ start:208 stop:327 length:120 start_codon:yes stop_codon:yes gene_type:complete
MVGINPREPEIPFRHVRKFWMVLMVFINEIYSWFSAERV